MRDTTDTRQPGSARPYDARPASAIAGGIFAPTRPTEYLPSPAEVRRRRRGERIVALLREYGDALRPILLDLLASDIEAIVVEALESHRG